MSKAKILIIEDKKDVALSITKSLKDLEYDVIATIASGEAAIQTISENPPDLVLIDIKLQGSVNSIEVAAQIHSRFQVPVVYIADYADDEKLESAKLTEHDNYIFHPFKARDLCTAIEICLYKHQNFQANLEKPDEEKESIDTQNNVQLKKENEQLQTEIFQSKRLANELVLALEKERELNELKSSILSTISHEYRTPLTTILSSTEMLEQYSSQWSEERKQKHFKRIKLAIKHLTNLVNDVLLVNQSEVGRLEFNPVPLNVESFARKLIEEFQLNNVNNANQHTIIFECQGTSTNAVIDEKLLESMLRNLLTNAIKYSPKGSLIQLELVFQKNNLVFRISDQGIGIPPADQDKLFTAFLRGSNVGTTPGVGLGLVIVKECVNLHGGKIVVESEVRVGTRFTITLPLTQQI